MKKSDAQRDFLKYTAQQIKKDMIKKQSSGFNQFPG
jgi:hypothetical protein